MRVVLLAATLFALAGCSTLDVKGQFNNGSEKISGTATGKMDNSGTLEVTISNGVKCNGTFVYETSRKGSGIMSCDNGASGPFTFLSTGSSGIAKGTLDGKPYTLTFGN